MIEKIATDINGDNITSLVQWDTNVYVYISDELIDGACIVHFVNQAIDFAYVIQSTYFDGKLKIKVPNTLLAMPYGITGFVRIQIDDGTRSMIRFSFNVVPRNKPNDYIDPGTEEAITVEKLEQDLQNAIDAIPGIIDQALEEAKESGEFGNYTKPETGIPMEDLSKEVQDAIGASGGAVVSVNGKTGEVVLTATDVNALPANTPIPEAVTDSHINSLIDAKLGTIEPLADSILEVL